MYAGSIRARAQHKWGQSAAHHLMADMIGVSACGDITRTDPRTQDEGHAKRMSKDTHCTCNSSEFQRPQQLHAIEAKLHTAKKTRICEQR
jgi:hypothetical protein